MELQRKNDLVSINNLCLRTKWIPNIYDINDIMEAMLSHMIRGDMVQWPAMLLGYIEQDKNEDAIQLYPWRPV